MIDPAQCLFDSSQKAPVGTVQLNLEFRFCIGICLVDGISRDAPRCRNHGTRALSQ
jgi:hypothetical protein